MPELPEVETVRRSLEPGLYAGSIRSVETSGKNLRQRPVDRVALTALVGARFTAARRHGKYLLLDVSSGQTVLVHLGMSGQLLLLDEQVPARPHTHVTLSLSSGRMLSYVDPRRFGIVRVYETAAVAHSTELAELGPDPINGGFEEAAFAATLRGTRREIKAALLDQTLVAGLGNIYVSEALFVARLSPRRRAHRLGREEATRLFSAIGEVLRRSVANRGTSLSDYVDSRGESGQNQHVLLVYGRDGQPCRACGARLRKIVQVGRSSYFCPSCQGRK